MSSSDSEYDLLFGCVALRLELVGREVLISSLKRRTGGQPPLGEVLVSSKVVDEKVRDSIDFVVHNLRPLLTTRILGDSDSWELGDKTTEISDPPTEESESPTIDLDPNRPAVSDEELTRTLDSAPGRGDDAEGTLTATQRYRILRLAARGGLGAVYLARDEALGREVALKMIHRQYSGDPDGRRRFLLEARITGNLEHPGIVGVHGIGEVKDAGPFYAMRFIKGDTLREVIDRFHRDDAPDRDPGERGLALRKLLGRFIGVCNAIAYAHSRGVLHRDLKPANIMVGKFGETLVVDWGLAKVLYDSESARRPIDPHSSFDTADALEMTASGLVVGTPGYMSPEQAAGRQDLMEPASDVFSLGATLYTILTGRPPFGGATAMERIEKTRRCEFPRPGEIKDSVHPALEAICLKALAREPEDRYSSPKALADDIERWLADAPVSAYQETAVRSLLRWSRRHNTTALVAASAVFGVALAIAALIFAPRPGGENPASTSLRNRGGTSAPARLPLSPDEIHRIADVIRQLDSEARPDTHSRKSLHPLGPGVLSRSME